MAEAVRATGAPASEPAFSGARYRLALLTNTLAPYRLPIYRALSSEFDLDVFLSGREANRSVWRGVEVPEVNIKYSKGISVPLRVHQDGVYDLRFFHLPLGHLLDLWRARPDAVISSELGLRTLIALLYGAVFKRPVWVWWGGTLHTERRAGPLRRAIRAILSRWASRWISYGSSSTEYLLELGVTREAILEIQNCVDESLYVGPISPALDLRPKPVLLFVGQMIQRKGVDKLLQAVAELQRTGYDFSLLLVGEGPQRSDYEAMSRSLGLQNVRFHAATPPEGMPAIYRSATYLVFPTLEDVWGLVVNEALWSDVPVLSSRFAGCASELLPADQLFDPSDVDDLVRVLRRALEERLPADTTRLKTCGEVAEILATEIRRGLSEAGA